MRFGTLLPACIVVIACAVPASADIPTVNPSQPQKKEPTVHREITRTPHFFSFRTITKQVDNQVIANLLEDVPVRASDVGVSIFTGEIARCESATCLVPMTVRVQHPLGPVQLTFAVASPRGEISEVKHAECKTGDCVVSLILERGQNTVSVGVLDGIAQATGYVTTRVNANRNVAEGHGKSEWF